jgi:lipoprotein-releasing system permease protein
VRTGPGFEWFVAWRHLRDPERRARGPLIVGFTILVVALLALGMSWQLGRGATAALDPWGPRPPLYVEYLRTGGVCAAIAGVLIGFFGVLRRTFTLFTSISIFGVFLGTCAPTIALSVMSGFEADLKSKIRGAKADVIITRKDDRPFTDWQKVQETLAGIPGVVASTPYVESEVMLQAQGSPAGVILRGIDPASATGVLDLERTLREGKVDDLAHPERVPDALPLARTPDDGGEDEDEGKAPKEPPERKAANPPADGTAKEAEATPEPAPARGPPPTILLGEELFTRGLHVFVGSDIDAVCPQCQLGPSGPRPGLRTFRVAGHFYSGMYDFDSKLAYVSLTEAQKFLDMRGEVTGVDVRTTTPDHAAAVATRAQALIGPDYEVRSWEELNSSLYKSLRLEKFAMFVVLTFIDLVAAFSIIASLVMMVTEKGKEVAILKAMGATDRAIRRIFFAEGLYIGLLGLAVGVSLGVVGCMLLKHFGPGLPTDVYYITKLPVVMRVGEIATVAALALVLCCLATIYPALVASRMRPVQGLRYE